MFDVLSMDLVWGVARYGGVGAVCVFLWHITQMEHRMEEAWDMGFKVGQVYRDPVKKVRAR